MLGLKRDGKIEYLRYESNDDSVLSYMVFTVSGSEELSIRTRMDVTVMESTYNVTKYDYILITALAIDSELQSRPIAFAITLHENPAIYSPFFEDCGSALLRKTGKVLFTDRGTSICAAIEMLAFSSLEADNALVHVTCLWHLLDMNIKKNVGPSIFGGLHQ